MPEKSRSEEDWRALVADQVDRNGWLFYKIAYGIVRDGPAAEDICQQAFLKAMESADQIRRNESLQAWLCKVVSNAAFALRRRRKLENKTVTEGRARPKEVVDRIEQWHMREAILEAADTLAEPMRTIVIMRLVNGFTGVEVARQLGYSVAYVSVQLRDGMAILRIALRDWKDPSDH